MGRDREKKKREEKRRKKKGPMFVHVLPEKR